MKREPVVTVATEKQDRTAAREKLRAYFLKNHNIFWSQTTLADMCGADRGAVRTRLSELKRGGMNLIAQDGHYRDSKGVYHRAPKTWAYIPRPDKPLGRDAGEPVARTLFPVSPRR